MLDEQEVNKPKVTAIVLKDGSLISEDELNKYRVTKSKQIKRRALGKLEINMTIDPPYNLDTLNNLLDVNPYHRRCVYTKAQDTAGIGYYLEPNEDIENPSDEQKKILKDFLKGVHQELTLNEILTRTMQDFESTGNGYLEIIRNEAGELIGFDHIPAHTMRIHEDGIRYLHFRMNEKRWFIKYGSNQNVNMNTGELGEFDEEMQGNEVIHFVNYSPVSDYYGVPDIVAASDAIYGDMQRADYNADFFENHAVPAYVVTIIGAEMDDEVQQYIKQYFQSTAKEKRHSTLVINAAADPNALEQQDIKVEFTPLAVDTSEASFRLYRIDNRDEIVTAHGVPPYRIGINETGSLGGSTAKESTEIYKQSILKPRKEMLETRLNKVIGKELEIMDWVLKLNELDTRDEEREIMNYEKLFNMGVLTPNKVRELWNEEKYNHPLMDMPFILGAPLVQWLGNQTDQQQNPELITEMKSLHERLLNVVTKGVE